MTCPHCGLDVPEFAAHCLGCGRTVARDTIPAVPDEPAAAEAPAAQPFEATPPASPWARADSDGAPPASRAAMAYTDPQHYLLAQDSRPTPAGDQSEPVAATVPKRRRLLAILIGALALLLVASGVAVAGGYLGWYGGGKRPSDVLPGSAVSYGQIDLDPSLLQKTAAWQFLRDLPEVKTAVAAGLPDPKAVLWKLGVKYDDYFEKMSYETEVKPWLGNRYGAVIVNHDGTPTWAGAVQLTNADLGVRTLKTWADKTGTNYDVTLRDGYALLTDPKETSFILGEVAKGTLAANPTFAADFAALGEPGIAAGWTDLGGWEQLSGQTVGSSLGVSHGRVAFATRFSADSLEVAGITRGFTGPAAIPDGDLGLLPADTGAAISITGGGLALAESWSQLPQSAKDSVADLKLKLPDDLAALFGNSLTLAASAETIEHFLQSSTIEVGLRVNSDAASRAEQVLHTLADGASPENIQTVVNGSVLVAGTTAGYRDRIAGKGQRLADQEWFAKAVPDHARATFSFWVDAKAALANAGSDNGEYGEFLAALRGWGSQFVPGEPGEGTWSVRVVRA